MTFADKAKKYKKDKRHRANAPDESIEDHYRVNYFIYTYSISHIHSPFPQELKAIFYASIVCGLEMFYVHRNDTVGQVNPEAVLKRWDLCGNRKIHLAFTD